MTEPTDEALENLFVEETGFDTDDFPAAIFDFARAVLEKWGQPAQAEEPVAYSIGNTLKWHEGKGLTNAQLFAAPQPVAREYQTRSSGICGPKP